MAEGTFVTALNCMDGRVQRPVFDWMAQTYDATYVDMVTEAGPNKVLTEGSEEIVQSMREKLEVSLNVHGSKVLATVGHHGCAGYSADKEEKVAKIKDNVALLKRWYPETDVIGLYVNEQWQVEKLI